jgi:environmental stress-induced protein Ves
MRTRQGAPGAQGAVEEPAGSMQILRESDYVTVPWKNGGGLTREILKVPPQAAAFDWRLSLATIATPGPFSLFDGYDRTLVLVRGAGVALDFGPHGRTTLRAPGQMVAFDGAWPTQCALIDGPSTDLNLIVARARAEAQAVILCVTAPEVVRTAGWEETLLCCVSGSVQIQNAPGEVAKLSGADVARCHPGDGAMTCGPQGSGPALLLIASLRHRDA